MIQHGGAQGGQDGVGRNQHVLGGLWVVRGTGLGVRGMDVGRVGGLEVACVLWIVRVLKAAPRPVDEGAEGGLGGIGRDQQVLGGLWD